MSSENMNTADDVISDIRVEKISPLISPALLLEDLPITSMAHGTVLDGRKKVVAVVTGESDKLVVVVGPCSIHDTDVAMDYAKRLVVLAKELSENLVIVMRVYFEKPRTTVGWKGLINDPDLDGSFKINKGLHKARQLLIDINNLGLPVGCEFLDTISPQFTTDLVTWGAIGARTTECQLHRELASGLSMPVGFKNGTGGNVTIAVDAIRSAKAPHRFLGVTGQGLAGIVTTTGNPECHVILRGGSDGPNYYAKNIADAKAKLAAHSLPQKIIVDCSHGNSKKKHTNQPLVASDLASQISGGEAGICGLMIESNIVEGRQDIKEGCTLAYGQSITDACISWETTEVVLKQLSEAVAERRSKL